MFQTKYSALPPSQYWEKMRENPSLYALFKHTYNAEILIKKIFDEIQPFMKSFFEKNFGLNTQKTFVVPENLFSGRFFAEKRFFEA